MKRAIRSFTTVEANGHYMGFNWFRPGGSAAARCRPAECNGKLRYGLVDRDRQRAHRHLRMRIGCAGERACAAVVRLPGRRPAFNLVESTSAA